MNITAEKTKQKFLVINTEAFSPKGIKQKKTVEFQDLPWVVRKFLSVYPKPFIVLDESSKIKVSQPTRESDKSTRTRLIKLLNNVGHRCIMTGTLMSKSPLNLIDQFEFLRERYFPESMWEFAEKYCVMETIRVGRGRRVLISKKDYETIRNRLRRAYAEGGVHQLEASKDRIYKTYGVNFHRCEHIMQHKKYTPFLGTEELITRIVSDTVFVKREDIFDVKFDKFVKEPICRTFELPEKTKKIGNELIKRGFTDTLVLGKVPALELQIRLQDICNGFEPVNIGKDGEKKEIEYRAFTTNPKLDCLMELLEEIDVEQNQVVVWSSRKLMLHACRDAFDAAGISYVLFDGDTKEHDKEEAKRLFQERRVQVFLANQASGAYGINCLTGCNYAVYLCVDGSVEKYHQSQYRLLRGQLFAPKFAYAVYAKGTVEERQWDTLRVGQELIGASNRKELFMFK